MEVDDIEVGDVNSNSKYVSDIVVWKKKHSSQSACVW